MRKKHLFEIITILAFGIEFAYVNSNHQKTSKVNEIFTILAFGIEFAYVNSNHQETSKVNVMESAFG